MLLEHLHYCYLHLRRIAMPLCDASLALRYTALTFYTTDYDVIYLDILQLAPLVA